MLLQVFSLSHSSGNGWLLPGNQKFDRVHICPQKGSGGHRGNGFGPAITTKSARYLTGMIPV